MPAASALQPLHGQESVASADVMNDPRFDKRVLDDKSNATEVDTCRICRGEKTDEEPLFHPCRCSGSIKFVHQDCLMEWLSHSRKKHCELCKTAFRFTKLYDPQMPEKLPFLVILERIFVYLAEVVITWLRVVLVSTVWLIWLPWSIRAGWRFLFWLAEGAWIIWNTDYIAQPGLQQAYTAVGDNNIRHLANETSTAVPAWLNSEGNSDASNTTTSRLLKRVLTGIGLNTISSVSGNASNSLGNRFDLFLNSQQHSSLLSDVTFLNHLTGSSTLNRLVIDTLEGQIISIGVVVVFVLIFLIREWVVQQQFGLNPAAIVIGQGGVRAPGDGEVPAQPVGPPAVQPRIDAEDGEHLEEHTQPEVPDQGPDLVEDVAMLGNLSDDSGPGHTSSRRRSSSLPSLISPPRTPPNITEESSEVPESSKGLKLDGIANSNGTVYHSHSSGTSGNGLTGLAFSSAVESDDQSRRPRLHSRNSSAAAEIRRILEECSQSQTHNRSNLAEIMAFWQRADCRADEFRRIVHEEGRTSELKWFLDGLSQLQENGTWKDTPSTLDQGSPLRRAGEDTALEHVRVESSSNAEETDEVSSEKSRLDYSSGRVQDILGDHTAHEEAAALAGAMSDILTTKDPESMPLASEEEGKVAEHLEDRHSHSTSNSAALPPQPSMSSVNSEQVTSREVSESSNQGIDPEVLPDSRYRDSEEIIQGQEFEDGRLAADATSDGVEHNRQTYLGAEPAPTDAAIEHPERPQESLVDRIMNWFWGDIPTDTPNEPIPRIREQRNQDDHQAGIVPFGQAPVNGGNEGAEGEVAEVHAGVLNQHEAEIVDDGDDLDGVMELVGLRGPLIGLFQNATFSAVLLMATIGGAIWIPYIWGKIVLVVMSHPFTLLVRAPIRFCTFLVDVLLDSCLFFGGSFLYWIDRMARTFLLLSGTFVPAFRKAAQITAPSNLMQSIAGKALDRLIDLFTSQSSHSLSMDLPVFSIASHEALNSLRALVSRAVGYFSLVTVAIHNDGVIASLRRLLYSFNPSAAVSKARSIPVEIFIQLLRTVLEIFVKDKTLEGSVRGSSRAVIPDFSMANWSATDRIITIFLGYAFFAVVGALYLRKSSPFSESESGRRIEAIINTILVQAGGVLKVILIISIEMIVFPLYCGLLLDLALLPLYKGATYLSRAQFAVHSPWTFGFIHWFIGTCYMFHFALFVSMCRKITRSGVLYFIRDPDDPSFHPVRDVLERNVTTQLRKIAFSALVYGALVIVCLGGVVWGFELVLPGILPIHWSSTEPLLEFPFDLLVYSFLMPSAVKFFKPSEGLQAAYSWWFRHCARALRLSWFLFGIRNIDEEGRQVRRTWWDIVSGKRGDVTRPFSGLDNQQMAEDSAHDAEGRYVFAPASDQVRIPKGGKVFIEMEDVDEMARRKQINAASLGSGEAQLYMKVYIPPWFRTRIALFILLIWVFAIVTGVSVTILPLVLGRTVFAAITPEHMRMNDVYAFFVGLYLLTGLGYCALHSQAGVSRMKRVLNPISGPPGPMLRKAYGYGGRLIRLLYLGTAFGIVLPALVAILVELFVLLPVHTFVLAPSEEHVVPLIQDWMLGVLFVKAAGEYILRNPGSRLAEALRGVVRNGWSDPDIRLATRAFILPAILVMGYAALAPLLLGWFTGNFFGDNSSAVHRRDMYRLAYPASLALDLVLSWSYYLYSTLDEFEEDIRDEVYLTAERLHNFGEVRARNAVQGR